MLRCRKRDFLHGLNILFSHQHQTKKEMTFSLELLKSLLFYSNSPFTSVVLLTTVIPGGSVVSVWQHNFYFHRRPVSRHEVSSKGNVLRFSKTPNEHLWRKHMEEGLRDGAKCVIEVCRNLRNSLTESSQRPQCLEFFYVDWNNSS